MRLVQVADEVAARIVDGERRPGSSRRRRAALLAHAARRYGCDVRRLRVAVARLLRQWRDER